MWSEEKEEEVKEEEGKEEKEEEKIMSIGRMKREKQDNNKGTYAMSG